MSAEYGPNLSRVQPEDVRSVFVEESSIDIARGCIGCPVFEISKLRRAVFANLGWHQPSLFDKTILSAPDVPRLEEELTVEEAKKRAEGGIDGSCKFIPLIDNCWRNRNFGQETQDQSQGIEYALQADRQRDAFIRHGRDAKRIREAADRLETKAQKQEDPDKAISLKRAKRYRTWGDESIEFALKAMHNHKAFIEVASVYLGEQQPGGNNLDEQ